MKSRYKLSSYVWRWRVRTKTQVIDTNNKNVKNNSFTVAIVIFVDTVIDSLVVMIMVLVSLLIMVMMLRKIWWRRMLTKIDRIYPMMKTLKWLIVYGD